MNIPAVIFIIFFVTFCIVINCLNKGTGRDSDGGCDIDYGNDYDDDHDFDDDCD